MSTRNTTAVVLEEMRESGLHDHTDASVVETAEALIREAEPATETLVQPRRDQRQLKPTYPQWPTSTPGPQATSPLPGMKPVPTRTDQMVYECYDQERGMPCTPVVEKPDPEENQAPAGPRHRTSHRGPKLPARRRANRGVRRGPRSRARRPG